MEPSKIFPEAVFHKSERVGWRGKTTFTLADGIMPAPTDTSVARKGSVAVLQIETSKTKGGINATATCARYEGGFISFEIFGDYMRTVMRSGSKCTEKSVRALHAEAVAMLPKVIEEAREFYRRKATGTGVRECYAGLENVPDPRAKAPA